MRANDCDQRCLRRQVLLKAETRKNEIHPNEPQLLLLAETFQSVEWIQSPVRESNGEEMIPVAQRGIQTVHELEGNSVTRAVLLPWNENESNLEMFRLQLCN